MPQRVGEGEVRDIRESEIDSLADATCAVTWSATSEGVAFDLRFLTVLSDALVFEIVAAGVGQDRLGMADDVAEAMLDREIGADAESIDEDGRGTGGSFFSCPRRMTRC